MKFETVDVKEAFRALRSSGYQPRSICNALEVETNDAYKYVWTAARKGRRYGYTETAKLALLSDELLGTDYNYPLEIKNDDLASCAINAYGSRKAVIALAKIGCTAFTRLRDGREPLIDNYVDYLNLILKNIPSVKSEECFIYATDEIKSRMTGTASEGRCKIAPTNPAKRLVKRTLGISAKRRVILDSRINAFNSKKGLTFFEMREGLREIYAQEVGL